ncbi:hypothetical protein [Vibrio aestuarianus]|uniref:hypothetical protein n=8 Tax=Vibrio TaxID=662 RepID=UPI00237CA598|nr:hypothetical protein [Vibrio aestuarianus]MDE1266195.1 hypothetical protein [Vibrio aestuarianus]MDE1298294.1 hypothetical protein [Vibrio aestuarianus]
MQADSIKNPMFDLLLFMQTYENNGLDDEKFIRKCKNLVTNFTKLYLSVDSILNENSSGFDYKRNELMRIQTIEYCYLKISTIWDLAYQIADDVLGYKKGNKYEKLENSFEEYKRSHDFLSLSWYQDINKIRNRIVHGGVNIIPFYDNDELMFNVYNENVDSVMPHCSIYSKPKGLMVSAGSYFIYYTSILYNYLVDFFSYVLKELKKSVKPTIVLDEFAAELIEERSGRWFFDRLSEYNAYARETLNLPLGENRNDYSKSRLSVTRFYEEAGTSPFKRKMIESIADKYSLTYEWLSENELSIPITEALISCSNEFYPEITKGGLDLRMSSPNEDRTASILKFEFSDSCYEYSMQ